MATGRTLVHAVIGAVVGIVLSFIPFSTIVGGAAAGFLEGPDGRDGAVVGALSGVIAFVPFAALAVVFLSFLGFAMGIAAAPLSGFVFAAFFLLVAGTFVLLYTVGLSALGGYLGAYLAREYPEKRSRTRRSIGMERRTAGFEREPVARGRRSESLEDYESTAEPDGGNDSRNEDWSDAGEGR